MLGKLQYSRYQDLMVNGNQKTMSHVQIDERVTDKMIVWKNNRMDKLSYTYYGDPRYGWIIMLANPKYSMEFDIEEDSVIRIPFPFKDVLNEIITKING